MDQGANPTAGDIYEVIPGDYEVPGTKDGQHDANVYAKMGGVDGRVKAAAKTAEPDGKSDPSTGDYTEIIPPVRPEPANGPVNDDAHPVPLHADILRS